MSPHPLVPALGAKVTFRGNVRDTRHGCLKLTPAYSLHLVHRLLDVGLRRIEMETLRRRTSKAELYEFVVSAARP